MSPVIKLQIENSIGILRLSPTEAKNYREMCKAIYMMGFREGYMEGMRGVIRIGEKK